MDPRLGSTVPVPVRPLCLVLSLLLTLSAVAAAQPSSMPGMSMLPSAPPAQPPADSHSMEGIRPEFEALFGVEKSSRAKENLSTRIRLFFARETRVSFVASKSPCCVTYPSERMTIASKIVKCDNNR